MSIQTQSTNIITVPESDPNTCELPEAYYYPSGGGKDYLYRPNPEYEKFIPLDHGSLKRQLKGAGYSNSRGTYEALSEVDTLLNRIQLEREVVYAGPLAGYQIGMYETENMKVLVTEPPTILQPIPGDWNVLSNFIFNLLGEKQQYYFFGWLKFAYEAVLTGKRTRPGQALFLAGPARSGKSLLQKLISIVIGGQTRVANPYPYMIGATTFNKELFSAEHLVIDDHPAINTITQKQHFTSELKEIVNSAHPRRCHGKGLNAIMLEPFWRLTISINDTDENLSGFLNWAEGGIEDKLMLFKTEFHEMPMPTNSDDERHAFWSTLVSELPHLLKELTEWDVPEKLLSPRFGVTHWHHPDLLAKIKEQEPEMRLLELIEGAEIFPNGLQSGQPWEGSAAVLQRRLSDAGYLDEIKKLCPHSNSCGTYIGRLWKKFPNRFKKLRKNGSENNNWVIYPPF